MTKDLETIMKGSILLVFPDPFPLRYSPKWYKWKIKKTIVVRTVIDPAQPLLHQVMVSLV